MDEIAKTKELKMTEQEIVEYTRNFLKEWYNMELDIPVKINGRLSSTLGRFTFNRKERRPLEIEISRKYLIHGKLKDIKSTLRHEATHYYCFVNGLDHRDGSDDFESELRRHNTNSTQTVRLRLERNVNVYECDCATHERIRALSDKGRYHSCNICKANLTYLGKRKAMV